MSTERLLVINACDLGRTESANLGIARAASDGVVTSASLMVYGAAARHAIDIAGGLRRLSLGLHFDAGEWKQHGDEWVTAYERVTLDDEGSVRAEARAQLERFHELTGTDPTHIDSHQHVLRRPIVRRVLRAMARELDIPLHGEGSAISYAAIAHRPDVAGDNDPGTIERLRAIIRHMPTGATVIECHPDIDTSGASPCCFERPTDVAALCDVALAEAIDDAGVTLVSYRELGGLRRSVATLLDLGRDAMMRDDQHTVIAAMRSALALQPSSAPAWLQLSRALLARGDAYEALVAARAATQHSPHWPAALWHLADLLVRDGDVAGADAIATTLCSIAPIDTPIGARTRIVLHALRSGSPREARDVLGSNDTPFAREASIPPSDMELGRKAFARGEFELAEQMFRRAQAVDGVRPWTSQWIARTLSATGRGSEAIAVLESSVSGGADDVALMLELADVLAAEGFRERAVELLTALYQRRPDDITIACTIAGRLVALSEHEKSVAIADRVLSSTCNPSCLIARAIALWHSGDHREAEGLLRDPLSPLSDRDRAELALAVDLPLEAWKLLAPTAQQCSGDGLVYKSAHALRRNGHLTHAKSAFACGIGPESKDAVDWIGKVSGEITVLSGRWIAPALDHPGFTPIEGRVLNLVGKSLPYTQSGYTIRTHSESMALRSIGIEPHVVTQLGYPWTIGNDAAAPCDVIDGVEYHRMLPVSGVPQRLDELQSEGTRHLADVVARMRPSTLLCASDFLNPMIALAVGRHFDLPVIYTVRGFWQDTWLSKRSSDALDSDAYRWRNERELECMRMATHVVTIAETMKHTMVSSGVPADKITVIPNAVDVEAFHRVERDTRLATELGIRDGEIVVGYISTFTGYEGITTLIDAAAELIGRGRRVRVLLVGDGEERKALEARARTMGIADRVVFAGRVRHDQVLAYYGLIDVFVVPRTDDRVSRLVTPLKPYEAMATERALIVSDVPALREMIVEGVTGLTFEPGNAENLASVIDGLLVDPERRRAMGADARAWVSANRTWRANCERFRAMFERLSLSIAAMIILVAGCVLTASARPPATKRVEAVRLMQEVVLDGALTETAWLRAPINDFRRYRPRSGMPSQRSDVWIAYDETALYVAARLFEADSTLVRGALGRRDDALASDWFTVALDPNGDGRTGFLFSVNPSGSYRDAALYDDGRTDYTWESAWQRASLIDSVGWTVEIRIPFSQLRFTSRSSYTWGINFGRTILHTGEELVYAGTLARVSRFASLNGLADIAGGRRIQFVPYAVASMHSYEPTPDDPFNQGRDYAWSVGGDLRYGFPSGMTLDATINPDFGQVEVDPAVVNLTAFETFFQEKRPFFSNSASMFRSSPTKGSEFFYSRRIGRSPQGRDPSTIELAHEGYSSIPKQSTILGAVKLTGNFSDSVKFGALAAVTEREHATIDSSGIIFEEEVEPATMFAVFRGRLEPVDAMHGFGALATIVARELSDDRLAGLMNSFAMTTAADFWLMLDAEREWSVRGWAGLSAIAGDERQMLRMQRMPQRYFQRPDADHISTDTSATSLAGWAGGLKLTREEGPITGRISINALSPSFELNDIGYSRFADRIATDASLAYSLYDVAPSVSEISLDAVATYEMDFGGDINGASLTMSAWGQSSAHWTASTSVTWHAAAIDPRATRGGPSMRSASGWDLSASIASDSRAPLMASATARYGSDDYGSISRSIGGEVVWRPFESVLLSVAPWFENSHWEAAYFDAITDKGATRTFGRRYIFAALDQTNTSVDVRLDIVMTPTLSLQLYAQPFDGVAGYSRYRELLRPRSGDFLFFGENGSTIVDSDGEITIDTDGDGPDEEFTIYDSNFEYQSLRGTAVLRWEYRPGSTVFLAWTQSRYSYDDRWQRYFRPTPESLMSVHPDNVFHLKFTYLIGS